MTFNKCSITGKCYGDQNEEQLENNVRNYFFINISNVLFYFSLQFGDRVDFSWNPYYEQSFDFYDKALTKDIRSGDANCHEFFRLLSLCHTVMPEIVDGWSNYSPS